MPMTASSVTVAVRREQQDERQHDLDRRSTDVGKQAGGV